VFSASNLNRASQAVEGSTYSGMLRWRDEKELIAAMPDDGHDLLFGGFLTPTARKPGEVVELARLSERSSARSKPQVDRDEAGYGTSGVPELTGEARAVLSWTSTELGNAPGKGMSWDEATRPVAPPAPAGFAYSARGKAVGRHLSEVHDHLRQELDQVRDLLEQVRQGSMTAGRARAALNQMTLRQSNWTLGAYCAAYCSVVTQHHGLEDRAIFPHLRGADPGLVPVIDRLEQEHVVIHQVIEDVDRALVRLVAEPDDFTGLQKAIDMLTATLRSHLAYEEQQISEPLSRYGFFPGQV